MQIYKKNHIKLIFLTFNFVFTVYLSNFVVKLDL